MLLAHNWHILDHLCEAILKTESLQSLHGGIYKASHKQFKLFYGGGSWRRRTATDEIISMQNGEKTEHLDEFIEKRDSTKTMNGRADKAWR